MWRNSATAWILRAAEPHEPARHVGVLVEVVARADPVVTVGDRQRHIRLRAPVHEQHRGEELAVGDLGEILLDVRVVRREQRQATRPQEIFRLAVDGLAGAQPLDEAGGFFLREQKRQVVGRCREVVRLGLVLPMLGCHDDELYARR